MIKSFLAISLIFKLMFACGGGSENSTSTSDSFGGGSPSGSAGQGGSLARFAVTKDHLYVVKNDNVQTLDIGTYGQINPINRLALEDDLETIFPRGNELFIGSMSGMYILGIENPTSPYLISKYEHVVACDPVVANSDYAYVTLRSSSELNCWNSVNEMQVISLEDLSNPKLKTQIAMVQPKGLGILKDKIFVCDNTLKMFDLSSQENPKLERSFNIQANDVIAYDDLLIVTADDGIYQYRLENDELVLLSKIGVGS